MTDPQPPALLEHLMGPDFVRLAPALQRFHRLHGHATLHGQATTCAPATGLARLLARMLGTPRRASCGRLVFRLTAHPATLRWTRHFAGQGRARPMASRLQESATHPGQLEECLGPVRLRFTLHALDGELHLKLSGMRCCGLPCPRVLLPSVTAVESGHGMRLHFHIEAGLPWAGRVTRYRGFLELGP
jgi:hypothetical protein